MGVGASLGLGLQSGGCYILSCIILVLDTVPRLFLGPLTPALRRRVCTLILQVSKCELAQSCPAKSKDPEAIGSHDRLSRGRGLEGCCEALSTRSDLVPGPNVVRQQETRAWKDPAWMPPGKGVCTSA